MKKKLTRKDFAGLRQSYPVLSKEEMRRYVAGRSTFYDENDWFLSNPYAMDMDMNMDMGMSVRNEKDSDEADGQFPLDMDVSVFSASSYGNGSGDDWFYHGFGGYDPDGNYHWYSGYTKEELENWEGAWYGGWVYGMGYVSPDINIYPGGYDYTFEEFMNMDGDWTGGVVEGIGFIPSETLIITYDPRKLHYSGVEDWDYLYRGGYDMAYNAGRTGTGWDDLWIAASKIISSLSAGSGMGGGGVDYGMIHYIRGLREGYRRGKEDARKYYYY